MSLKTLWSALCDCFVPRSNVGGGAKSLFAQAVRCVRGGCLCLISSIRSELGAKVCLRLRKNGLVDKHCQLKAQLTTTWGRIVRSCLLATDIFSSEQREIPIRKRTLTFGAEVKTSNQLAMATTAWTPVPSSLVAKAKLFTSITSELLTCFTLSSREARSRVNCSAKEVCHG